MLENDLAIGALVLVESAFDQMQATQSKEIELLGELEDWVFNEDGNLW